jgi:hypothetical protein
MDVPAGGGSTDNIAGSAVIVAGVGPDYDPAHTAAALRELAG